MIKYVEIADQNFPIRFSYQVITKQMGKLGLKKFVEIEKLLTEIPAEQMPKFIHEAICAGCKKTNDKAPDLNWIEENLEFTDITKVLEVLGEQLGGGNEGESTGNVK